MFHIVLAHSRYLLYNIHCMNIPSFGPFSPVDGHIGFTFALDKPIATQSLKARGKGRILALRSNLLTAREKLKEESHTVQERSLHNYPK